ncbi:WecB/TagA/CpsF family glycosyltransferase [Aneurinibacillus sp. Ricciae_BoGa-3]|uniref:WecB/TagA/CpsF family glycosyltransferase n=1 Tax=Aneurinibacillus sp. Ricciae_BoGa-3 TaxID=3022697 RepID=UPI00233F8312|nr:WecB/TagA/CpsF family glycosyltransferase [Aneurinibacillus sp. Ricciae_BoGa-3]WCK54302.1 WecB/TagA/CpsF family glycosyltransferase [Aneurinibacillus sp. Ricciae_BoGa-3]
MNTYKRVEILQVPFLQAGFNETVELLTRSVTSNAKIQVVTANPEIVMMGRQDPEYMKLLQQAGIITPDGIGIVLASRWIGQPVSERVSGYDLLHGLMKQANRYGWKYMLVGASPSSSDGAALKLKELYPNAVYAGHYSGYFTEEEEPDIVKHIQQEKPQLLFVALGAPRQEKWIARHLPDLPVNIVMGVGGSFDVLSGTVKRAPELFQKLNLEWFYRLVSQPKRWKRQLLLPKFAISVLWNQVLLRRN